MEPAPILLQYEALPMQVIVFPLSFHDLNKISQIRVCVYCLLAIAILLVICERSGVNGNDPFVFVVKRECALPLNLKVFCPTYSPHFPCVITVYSPFICNQL